jgi:hypothetical protein
MAVAVWSADTGAWVPSAAGLAWLPGAVAAGSGDATGSCLSGTIGIGPTCDPGAVAAIAGAGARCGSAAASVAVLVGAAVVALLGPPS